MQTSERNKMWHALYEIGRSAQHHEEFTDEWFADLADRIADVIDKETERLECRIVDLEAQLKE